jgi:hypothetical protein
MTERCRAARRGTSRDAQPAAQAGSRRRRSAAGLALLALLALGPLPLRAERTPVAAPAAEDPAGLCEAAAARVARESGVPLSVLRAISLTETGRRRAGALRPWPWTVNMEGAGEWFDTSDEAKAYVLRHHQRGARSYDVGCFQLNYRWHGQHFASIEEMFDPLANARYAARFLADLYAESGDWSRAAGAYHSRTPRYAERYRARFDRIRAQLEGLPAPNEAPLLAAGPAPGGAAPGSTRAAAPAEAPPPRLNTFPLLQAAAAPRGLGSLVPLAPAQGRRLIGPVAPGAAEEAGDAG